MDIFSVAEKFQVATPSRSSWATGSGVGELENTRQAAGAVTVKV